MLCVHEAGRLGNRRAQNETLTNELDDLRTKISSTNLNFLVGKIKHLESAECGAPHPSRKRASCVQYSRSPPPRPNATIVQQIRAWLPHASDLTNFIKSYLSPDILDAACCCGRRARSSNSLLHAANPALAWRGVARESIRLSNAICRANHIHEPHSPHHLWGHYSPWTSSVFR